jgi:protein-L-isoaspartate(D-aspartate) O-methyltransferase
MAWRCSGNSNAALVNNLRTAAIVTTPTVEKAMMAVDRGNFVRDRDLGAYLDSPQPIGYGQTISAPHMHATVLEMLADQATVGHSFL